MEPYYDKEEFQILRLRTNLPNPTMLNYYSNAMRLCCPVIASTFIRCCPSMQCKPLPINSDRSRSAPTSPDQSRPDQSRPDQSHPDQSHPDQSHPDQSHPNQSHPDQSHPDQSRPNKSRPVPISVYIVHLYLFGQQ